MAQCQPDDRATIVLSAVLWGCLSGAEVLERCGAALSCACTVQQLLQPGGDAERLTVVRR